MVIAIPKVSIIVPIYNVEKFLPKCVESIRNQTLKDIEIILVDDESPDNCPKMIDDYAKEDERIVAIHQKNKWLGGARNGGLNVAKGKYIICLDADDYISPNFCERLFNFSEKNKCDITHFSMNIVNNSGQILYTTNGKERIFKNKNTVFVDQFHKNIYPNLLKSYELNFNVSFFNRSIIDKGFLFDEDIRYAEDYEAALRVYKLANSVGYLDEPLYYYRQNDESIMHVVKFERLKQIIHLFELREQFIIDNNLQNDENLFNSAHLLIKLFIEKFPMVFGIKNKKYSTKRSEIKEILKDSNLQKAIKRIKVSKLDMGFFGKVCFIAMKIKSPSLIILLSSIYSAKTK